MKFNEIEYKKPFFKIKEPLSEYLIKYSRSLKIPLQYEDLLRYSGLVPLENDRGEPTLWNRVIFNSNDMDYLYAGLVEIYRLLISDGSKVDHLTVDGVDFCGYGNSKPFRIKILNLLNDNYDYYYIKIADASRVYGLELEHHFSPNKINYIYYENTLIEEHIIGIPGDVFMETLLTSCTESEKAQIAKEFVKFNERCMIRLLGDMRAYNYVIVPIHDFDQVVYKIRPIDFDQQCYEGNFKIYRPQFFKENAPMVRLVRAKLQESSIEQYKNEERAALAKRIISSENRIKRILRIMGQDNIAPEEHIEQLKMDLYRYTNDMNFKNAKRMGNVLSAAFKFITRNYRHTNLFKPGF